MIAKGKNRYDTKRLQLETSGRGVRVYVHLRRGPGRRQHCVVPPHSKGFWKNHPRAWKTTSLTLGTTSYTEVQALKILGRPVRGDASLILADQLIAALLDIANGTDPTPVAKTIADANSLLGAGPIPEGVAESSTVGQKMTADASVLNNFNNGHVTRACAAVLPQGSCQPSGSLSALVSGTTVVAYVPKGSWRNFFGGSGATGVSTVNVEPTPGPGAAITTANAVNSCASNSVTGQTVCTANNTDVYLLSGTALTATLTSGATGSISFSGGSCTNCGVAMDGVNNKALIWLSIAGAGGFQSLDLSTSTFGALFASSSPAGLHANISEDPLVDPIQSTPPLPGTITLPLLLSASENNNYEIAGNAESGSPSFFENPIPNSKEADSSGADCSTGIALTPYEGSSPSQVFIADLTQATFTPGSPGTWTTAASQVQTLSESALPSAGASGIAVAQGTHTGVISDEFSGDFITAIALPMTSGSGTPAIGDWVTCEIGGGFSLGGDPHTVTAYKSPNGASDAIALLTNGSASTLAKVDLTQMLNTGVVGRTVGGHGCAAGVLPATVVTFISVP